MFNGVGEILKNARLSAGLSIGDIEERTKIRSKYLEAIEEENFEILPGKVYVKAFVKSYAKSLDLDNDKALLEFLDSKYNANPETIEEIKYKQEKIVLSRGWNKKAVSITLGIAAIILLFMVQRIYNNYLHQEPYTPPPISQNQIPSEEQKEQSAHVPIMETKPEKIILGIEIIDVGAQKEACWIQIAVDSQLVYEGTLFQGDFKTVEGKEKISITLGNAGVAKISIGDKDLGVLGKLNQVVTKEFTISDME
ncbi:MAG: helix-turn-helix domain-containing protein [Bacillota bacterium]